MSADSLSAWALLAHRGLGHQMYQLNGSHFTTTTSSSFTTFLQLMPYPTTFSFSAEVMVVLAALPLMALGMSGLTVAVFQLALAKVNRPFIDLFIAVGLAFLGGLFQLFNVLTTEAQGNQFMSPTLLRLQGVALGWFVGFKFFYLYRRTQQPALNEVPRLVRVSSGGGRAKPVAEAAEPSHEATPIRTGEGPGSGGRRMSLPDEGELSRTKLVMIHSGSYARWGTFGDVLKVFVFLFIILITFIDATWRVGFVRNVRSFRGIYSLSNALQIALLVFFAGKVVHATWGLELRPRSTNFLRVGALLAGMGVAFAVAVTALVPRLLLFSETPLGRLFVLLEVFIFLLELMIRDHQRPHRDSWSFEPRPAASDGALARPSLAKHEPNSAALSDGFGQAQATPTLPERIVVRHGSVVPSWLDDQRLRGLPARLSTLIKPPPPRSPLAQRSSAYLVPSPGPKRTLTGKGGAGAGGPEDGKPVLYIRTALLPQRPREQSPDASEGVSTMLFPESVRMSEVSVEGVMGTESSGAHGSSDDERVLFPIEESPPPLPERAGLVASPVSAFVQPVVPLAVVRQLSLRQKQRAREEAGAALGAAQASPSVYSGPTSSLGHVDPSGTHVPEPPPQPTTKVPQMIGAFASASSQSTGSAGKPSPPGSNDSPPPPIAKPVRTPTQSPATRPIILQPGDSPVPYRRPKSDEVLVIRPQRPQATPLAQPHLSIESLAAELDRGSAESGLSVLSLSRFPTPPPMPRGGSGSAHSRKPSHSGSLVTEGGFEFELMPPRRLGDAVERDEGMGRAREVGARAGRPALDVTSFVVGDRAGGAEARRTRQDEVAERQLGGIPSVDSSLPAGTPAFVRDGPEASPAMSDFLIQEARATLVPSSASSKARSRSGSDSTASTPKSRPPRQPSNLLVEAQGRQIPPRAGFLARTLVNYAASAAPPPRPSPPGPPPRSVLPYLPRRREPSPPSSGSEAEAASLLDSFASRGETGSSSSSVAGAGVGVPFRMFEQPRTPPLHLIREWSDGESDEGRVESVKGSSKGAKGRRGGS